MLRFPPSSPFVIDISTVTAPESWFSSSSAIGPMTHLEAVLSSNFSLHQRSSFSNVSDQSYSPPRSSGSLTFL